MKFKYWIDEVTETDNIIILSSNALFLASADKEHIEATRKKLEADTNPVEVFGTDCMTIIPLTIIQSIVSRNTDRGVDLKYKTKKEVEDKLIDFKSTEQKASFIRFLSKVAPDTLTKRVVQQKAIDAAISPLISLLIGLSIVYFFFDKLRWPAIIIGGLWAIGSAYLLFSRLSNPPEVTRWLIKGKHLRKTWSGIKTGFSYLFLLFIGVGIYAQFPDSYGANSIIQRMDDIDLKAGDVAKFVERGADLNARNSSGETPLYQAMNYSDNILAIELIKQGADVNLNLYSDDDTSWPLKYALQSFDDLSIARELLKNGASVDISIDDMPLLEWVKQTEDNALIELLSEFGVK